jgi:steroid delta-isomerase-like uncharacterized protein
MPDKAAPTALGESWARSWSEHDVEGLAALFSEDCEYEDVAFGVVNPGREGVRSWANGFLASFPDLIVEPLRAFEVKGLGVLEWEMGGTHRGEFDGIEPTGRRFEVRGVTVFEFEAGLIKRCADYWNLGDVKAQLRGAE